jgi:hypothetical protein
MLLQGLSAPGIRSTTASGSPYYSEPTLISIPLSLIGLTRLGLLP